MILESVQAKNESLYITEFEFVLVFVWANNFAANSVKLEHVLARNKQGYLLVARGL